MSDGIACHFALIMQHQLKAKRHVLMLFYLHLGILPVENLTSVVAVVASAAAADADDGDDGDDDN